MKITLAFLGLLIWLGSDTDDICVRHWESMDYDQLSRSAHLQGEVKLAATIGPSGSVEEVKIIVAHAGGILPTAAAKNLTSWKFSAGNRRTFEVTYDFRLVDPPWDEAPTRMTVDFPSHVSVESNYRRIMQD